MTQTWEIQLRTVPESNCSEHWTKKRERHATQAYLIRHWWNLNKPKYTLPLQITLVRISPRKLDKDDNLPMSFKWIKDAIADRIFPGKAAGRADDSEQLIWKYDQEKSKKYSIKIIFESLS